MEKLFTPDFGLMVWTVATFLLLLLVLGKFGWGPMIKAIEERESGLRSERQRAETARAEAEKIKAEMEKEMAGLQAKGREMLAQTQKEAESLRTQLKASAEADSQKIREKTMQDLADEKERLVRELRKEVAGLSLLAAERLMRKTVDEGVQKTVLEGFFKDLDAEKRHN